MKPEVSEQLFIEELFTSSERCLDEKSCEIMSIDRLTGDASTRRYYRIETSDNKYVACLDNPTEEGENTFVNVQEFLKKFDVRVPEIIDKNLSRGYLLEEDLGDTTLLNVLSTLENKEEEFEIYKKIIDELIKIHKIKKKDIETTEMNSLSFDYDKLISEIEFCVKHFIQNFLGVEDSKVSRDIISFFSPICRRLGEAQKLLTHRDFHSRNIMVKDDEFIIIDFQDARLGIPQYDLASLLDDCYYELERGNKEELLKYYYNSLNLSDYGQNSYEEFLDYYNDMVIQRTFKAIGSFAYIYGLRQDLRYVKYIGFAMEKLKGILLQKEKYSPLRKTLFKHYYES